MHIHGVLSALLLISQPFATAVISCTSDFGLAIQYHDCQQSLSDLHAALIQNDLLLRDSVFRTFGRGSQRNYRDRLPQAFPWRSCALGLDIYGNEPRQILRSTWKPLYDELLALMNTCVLQGSGSGGSAVRYGLRFVVANPASPNVLGTCLADPMFDDDLGHCVLARATETNRAFQEALRAMENQRARQRMQLSENVRTVGGPQETNTLQELLRSPGGRAGPSNANAGGPYGVNISLASMFGSHNASGPFGPPLPANPDIGRLPLGPFNASGPLGPFLPLDPSSSGLQPEPLNRSGSLGPFLPLDLGSGGLLQEPLNASEVFGETDPNEPSGSQRSPLPAGPPLADPAAMRAGAGPPSAPIPLVPFSIPPPISLSIAQLSTTAQSPGRASPALGTSWIERGVWVQQGPRGPQGIWMRFDGVWQPLGKIQRAYKMDGRVPAWFSGVIPELIPRVFAVVDGQHYGLVGGTPPVDGHGVIYVAPGTPRDVIVLDGAVLKTRRPLILH